MNPNSHLTEEALNDVLIGSGTDAAREHLLLCPQCAQKMEAFEDDLKLFNAASLAWSESRPLPRPQVQRERAFRPAHSFAPLQWGIATAVLLVAVGVPAWQHLHKPPMATPAPTLIASADNPDSAEQIAQDNAMLQSVNAALESSEEPGMTPYDLSRKTNRLVHKRPETRNR